MFPDRSAGLKKALSAAAAALFWLLVWEIAARRLDLSFAVPTVEATFEALISLARTAAFWQTLVCSLGRILLGLAEGTLLAILAAALTIACRPAYLLIRPAMTVIRCTPVASFIMILWILTGRDAVPTVIALLMVMPVIWQSLQDGWQSLDGQLSEVLTVFRASPLRRLRLLILPGLRAPFLTALANAAGLAWKAGVAAEIITYTSHSIGREIADARNLFNGPEMFAWTLCVIALSLLIERLIALPGRRLTNAKDPD